MRASKPRHALRGGALLTAHALDARALADEGRVPSTPVDVFGLGWKGKVDKLKRALEKQTAKHQKAIDKGKSEAYIEYKAAKMDYTKGLIKLAKIMDGLKKSGLL